MQLFNQVKQFVVKNSAIIRCLLFVGGMLLNLFVYIDLHDQKTQLSIEEAKLQQREYEVSNRETNCSNNEQYLSLEKDILNISMDIMDQKNSKLEEYNDLLQQKTEDVNEKIKECNEQYDTVESLAKKVSSSENIYIPTQDEIDKLCQLVYAEAGNQPYEGKLAVAEVVFNRVESPSFPNNINDVIFQEHQFSPCSNGYSVRLGDGKEVPKKLIIEDGEIEKAVFEAWNGSNTTETMLYNDAIFKGITDSSYWEGGALYFSNPQIITDFASSSLVNVNIQDHCFKRK